MSKSPWKTISKRIVYQNPWVKMHEHNIVKPDGSRGIYGFLDIPDGVGIVALSGQNKIQLIGEWRYPINCHTWSIICGTREKGESPLQSAKRELEEEASMRSNDWKSLGAMYPSPGLVKEKVYLYVATNCQRVQKQLFKPANSEKFNYQEVTVKQAVKMMKRGTISDGYAICGILLAKEMLKL